MKLIAARSKIRIIMQLNCLIGLICLLFGSQTFAQNDVGSSSSAGAGPPITQDSNKVTPFKVRENYWKRYPYAQRAFADPNPQEGPPGDDLKMPMSKGSSQLYSVGPGYGRVHSYHWVVRFCSDWWDYEGIGDPLRGVCYWQPDLWADDLPATKRDNELFETALTGVVGLPMSDTQFQILDRENNQRFLELLFDPERVMWMATSTGQMQGAAASNSEAGAAETSFRNAFSHISQEYLINVANENAAVPTSASNPNKKLPQVIWMVQQMYKYVFLPMALLFLLPGTILSQVQSVVNKGMLGSVSMPFEGILRAMIAIFLIPATQLFVSYAIDIGNSMTYSVQPWIDQASITNWSIEQSYNEPVDSNLNYIPAPDTLTPVWGIKNPQETEGIPVYGKDAEQPETKSKLEKQTVMSQVMQLSFNAALHSFSYMVIVLAGYQAVFMCYLFLLGPLSACFFAWPSLGQNLFRNVFSDWLNAVINVSLWRFWWCAILAIMAQRILWLQDTGQYRPDAYFETMVFNCFLGLMMYVPFQPWSFQPGTALSQVLQQGSQLGGSMAKQTQATGQQLGVSPGVLQAATGMQQQAGGDMGKVATLIYQSQNQQLMMQQGGMLGGQQGGQPFGPTSPGVGTSGGAGQPSGGGSQAPTAQGPGGGSTGYGPPPGSGSVQSMSQVPLSTITAANQQLGNVLGSMGIPTVSFPPPQQAPTIPLMPQAAYSTGAPATGAQQPSAIATNPAMLQQNPQIAAAAAPQTMSFMNQAQSAVPVNTPPNAGPIQGQTQAAPQAAPSAPQATSQASPPASQATPQGSQSATQAPPPAPAAPSPASPSQSQGGTQGQQGTSAPPTTPPPKENPPPPDRKA